MRIPGYCYLCRRITRVTATGRDVALAIVFNTTPRGLCDECLEKRP